MPITAPVASRRFGWLKSPGLLAVVGGVAWGSCHAARPLPGLSWVALVPLLLLLGSERPARFGWLHGVVSWTVAIPWIVPTITTFGLLPGWLGGLALLLLAAFYGLYDAAFAALGSRLWRRGDPLSLAALPALWVALEYLRSELASGFPWNLAAYAWVDLPGALTLSSWVGAFGVSALVVLPSLGIARALATRRWELAPFLVLGTAIVLALGARFSRPPVVVPAPAARASERSLPPSFAILQPNIPNRPVFDPLANEADYRKLIAMTEENCVRGRLLIWPESAAWPRDWQDDARLRADIARFNADGCALLFNSPFTVGERTYNSVLLVGADGGVQRVEKRHLVPFGEYVPFRRALPFLGKIARTVGDFAPASSTALLEQAGERLGVAVCYEVIFADEVAELVAAGATILVTVTNDAWYGDTAAPWQHLRAARFRAAENRRWLLRAAITGVSALIGPDGAVEGQVGVGDDDAIRGSLLGRSDRSPYQRAPWVIPLLAALLAGGAWIRGRRSPRSS